jgi:hypothetical protein
VAEGQPPGSLKGREDAFEGETGPPLVSGQPAGIQAFGIFRDAALADALGKEESPSSSSVGPLVNLEHIGGSRGVGIGGGDGTVLLPLGSTDVVFEQVLHGWAGAGEAPDDGVGFAVRLGRIAGADALADLFMEPPDH